jgi:DNA-binding response OmpR family regulator
VHIVNFSQTGKRHAISDIALSGRKDRAIMMNETLLPKPKNDRERPLALVVNDTQEILELFRDILVEEGYDVILNTYAPRDLEQLLEIDPDLVILDFMIGDEAQGWQLLQKMKMHRQADSIPVIVCTGAVGLVRELQGHLASKNVGIVVKPFDIDDLLRTIANTIRAVDINAGVVSTAEPVSAAPEERA